MTLQHLTSVDARGRVLRVRHRTTQGLRLVGKHIESVTVYALAAAAAAVMINGVVEFASILDVTSNQAILLVLVTYGAARMVESIAFTVADWIDPDMRDDGWTDTAAPGDDLWDASAVFQANAAAIAEGADYDEIRLAFQASQVLPALHGLFDELRNAYAVSDEPHEAAALSDTVALVRKAAVSFGHHDIGQ